MRKELLYEMLIGALALMMSLILILEIIVYLPYNVIEVFHYIKLIIWFIFIIDYVVNLLLSKAKVKFIRKNIIDFLVIIPLIIYVKVLTAIGIFDNTLILSIARIIMLITLLIKFERSIISIGKINKLSYMIILTTTVILMGAVAITLLENISFGDALWWSFVTFTTVGYGDVLLKTTLGRCIAILLMIFGIGFIGVTTSTIAWYIINGDRNIKKLDYKQEAIQHIKNKLDNLDSLSDAELEYIYVTLKAIRSSKRKM